MIHFKTKGVEGYPSVIELCQWKISSFWPYEHHFKVMLLSFLAILPYSYIFQVRILYWILSLSRLWDVIAMPCFFFFFFEFLWTLHVTHWKFRVEDLSVSLNKLLVASCLTLVSVYFRFSHTEIESLRVKIVYFCMKLVGWFFKI